MCNSPNPNAQNTNPYPNKNDESKPKTTSQIPKYLMSE